jgi:hypothetical protein
MTLNEDEERVVVTVIAALVEKLGDASRAETILPGGTRILVDREPGGMADFRVIVATGSWLDRNKGYGL